MPSSRPKLNPILRILLHKYPVRNFLHYSTPVQFLVAVILSAQCTDDRVNLVTKSLFKKYKTAHDFARANPKTFEREIYSTGFYKNKAKNIISTCKKINREFNGKVPSSMEFLLTLPGVARKTANVVLSTLFDQYEGIAVDTHVLRLSQRLGLTHYKVPEKVELDLMQQIPQKFWWPTSIALISHGRSICFARKPLCAQCPVRLLCPSAVYLKFQ